MLSRCRWVAEMLGILGDPNSPRSLPIEVPRRHAMTQSVTTSLGRFVRGLR